MRSAQRSAKRGAGRHYDCIKAPSDNALCSNWHFSHGNMKRFTCKVFPAQFSNTETLINTPPVSFTSTFKTLFIGSNAARISCWIVLLSSFGVRSKLGATGWGYLTHTHTPPCWQHKRRNASQGHRCSPERASVRLWHAGKMAVPRDCLAQTEWWRSQWRTVTGSIARHSELSAVCNCSAGWTWEQCQAVNKTFRQDRPRPI